MAPSLKSERSIQTLASERARDASEKLQREVSRNLSVLPATHLSGLDKIDNVAPKWGKTEDERVNQLTSSLASQIPKEVDQVATRLLVQHPELHSVIDRLRSEAELRFAIAVPMTAVFVVLAVRTTGWWLVGLAAVLLLVNEGAKGIQGANAAAIDALLVGSVESPALERLRRDTDQAMKYFTYGSGGSPAPD